MSERVSVHVSETGESVFAVRIESGKHVWGGDESVAMGGSDIGPAPYQMLAAALGECTAMTVRWYARRQGWPVEHVAVDVTHEKAAVDGHPGLVDVFRKTLHVKGLALTDEQRARLEDVAAKCPVQRTLEGAPVIITESL